jgi:hypothetical protein
VAEREARPAADLGDGGEQRLVAVARRARALGDALDQVHERAAVSS